jgi:Cu(I)/Ag(I) efflux system membrane fusion protein
VVVEGNFKIDSALQIRAKASMMSMPASEEEEPPSLRTYAAPAAFRAQLGEVIELYVEASTRLAADDATAARLSLVALGAALDGVEMGALDAEAHLAWMKDAKTLGAAVAEATRSGGDIERQRRGFLALSETLPGVLRRWTPTLAGTLHRFHCPMAFDDRGADWFQLEERIANPYFGAAMLRCGEIKETLSSAEHGHGAHEH